MISRIIDWFKPRHACQFLLITEGVTPFQAWAEYNVAIDLTIRFPDDEIAIYECKCGRREWKLTQLGITNKDFWDKWRKEGKPYPPKMDGSPCPYCKWKLKGIEFSEHTCAPEKPYLPMTFPCDVAIMRGEEKRVPLKS